MAKADPPQYPSCATLYPTHASKIPTVPAYTKLRYENQHPEIL